jgi:hypothetical protein
MHRVKPNQSVRILTIQLAVPADQDENEICDSIVELLDGDIECEDGVILDWCYVFGEDRIVQAGGDPDEGDVFYVSPHNDLAPNGDSMNAVIQRMWNKIVAYNRGKVSLAEYLNE